MAKTSPYLLLITLLSILIIFSSPCMLFNMGDSNTDTGSPCGLYGHQPHQGLHGPTCRSCDGFLYLDFLCESLGMDFLVPYMEPVGSNFTNGVNFAVYAVTAQTMAGVNFPLGVQVDQFAHFRNRTLELMPKGKGRRITEDEFRNAVFSIDIGQNDVYGALGHPVFEVVIEKKIPKIPESIENQTKRLHALGGRKFLMYNTGPLGFLPMNTDFGPIKMDLFNKAARAFNEGLSSLCVKLRCELKDATIIYTDMYAVKYDIIVNSSKYGFETSSVPCKGPPTTKCRSVFWDNAHYSEAANKIVATKIWSGDYSSPHIKLKQLCDMVVH